MNKSSEALRHVKTEKIDYYHHHHQNNGPIYILRSWGLGCAKQLVCAATFSFNICVGTRSQGRCPENQLFDNA